jgi:hypothetical protein
LCYTVLYNFFALVFALIRVHKYNTREKIRESSPATNPVFSRVCGEFNNKI